MLSAALSIMLAMGGTVEFNTDVFSLMQEVDSNHLTEVVAGLSGEEGVIINGMPDSIPCRFALCEGEYKAALWLAEQFEVRGFEVELEPFEPDWNAERRTLPLGTDAGTLDRILAGIQSPGMDTMWNVVATLQGKDDVQVLLTAHFDAISNDYWKYTPGADDNASGVAGVLEAARILSEETWQHTLRFVLFSGEELGLLGSAAYVDDAVERGDSILGVLNLDMIAWDGDPVPEIDIHSHPWEPRTQGLGELLADIIDVYSLELVTDIHTTDATDRSDHASFWHRAKPAILLIEDFDDFTPYYHTVSDRLSTLDVGYMVEAVKASVGWVATMADDLESTAIEEQIALSGKPVILRLSSNLVKDQISLDISTPNQVTLCIYDASGREQRSLSTISPSAGRHLAFDVSDLPAGVFWIGAKGPGGITAEKFSILR